jgi:hypothetical protein
MTPDSSTHIASETLKKFVLRRVPQTDIACIEEHLLICHKCSGRLLDAVLYLTAMRGPASD